MLWQRQRFGGAQSLLLIAVTATSVVVAGCSDDGPTLGQSSEASGTEGDEGSKEVMVDAPMEGSSGTQGTDSTAHCSSEVVLGDENNFEASPSFSFDATKVAPRRDLEFDWSELTTDMQGRPLDPATDIQMLVLITMTYPLEQLGSMIAGNDPDSSDVHGLLTLSTQGRTAAKLLDFGFNGQPVGADQILERVDDEAYPASSHTYLLTAQAEDSLGQGVRMMGAFVLDSESDNTRVQLHANSATFDAAADLTSSVPVRVPAGVADVFVDWSSLTMNGAGEDGLLWSDIRVTVARFDRPLPELEENFASLEQLAQARWTTTGLSNVRSANLGDLVDASGAPFPGIDETGTWLFAVQCFECARSLPEYMVVLEPCAQ